MGKLRPVLIGLLLSLLLAVPVYAQEGVTWPPPPYEMPVKTAYTADMFSGMMQSIKTSLGAISSTGFLVFGVTASVMLIGSVFFQLVLNKLALFKGAERMEFRRKVKAFDRSRNLDSIVEDKVADMEVSYLAKSRWRLRHPTADLNEKIYQREVGYQADLEVRKRHPKWESEGIIHRKEAAASASVEYIRRNPALDVESRVANRQASFEANGKFRNRNPNYVFEKAVYDRQYSAQVGEETKRRSKSK